MYKLSSAYQSCLSFVSIIIQSTTNMGTIRYKTRVHRSSLSLPTFSSDLPTIQTNKKNLRDHIVYSNNYLHLSLLVILPFLENFLQLKQNEYTMGHTSSPWQHPHPSEDYSVLLTNHCICQ